MKVHHRIQNNNWLRASVLGANDGIVSTTCLILTVVMAGASLQTVLLTGVAGLVSGALSMAAGEYVSVSSQQDAEHVALGEEKQELVKNFRAELNELADIYVSRGLSENLAKQVAGELMQHNALDAHARDELGINEYAAARPWLAASSSAISFSIGAGVPLLSILVMPSAYLAHGIIAIALLSLATLGFVSARVSGAPALKAVARVVLWSSLAMAVTSGIGLALGVSV